MSAKSFRERYAGIVGAFRQSRPERSSPPEWQLPAEARPLETVAGVCVVHDRVYGGSEIARAWHSLSSHGLTDGVFLDTETTGLSGGTGTLVFLVGVGRFIGETFHVRQYFMRHPGEERALLAAVREDIGAHGTLFTYNGRSFDVPLLETRFRMHGDGFQRPDEHVDLLPTARAVWKHRLPSCSLGTIEEYVLGVRRENDAPGWMIPGLYLDYVRSRVVAPLEPVFEHNRMDIVSLARIAGILRDYETGAVRPQNEIDQLAVALVRLRRGEHELAVDEIRSLWRNRGVPTEIRQRAFREMSISLKRAARYDVALEEWTFALGDPAQPLRMFATEELAKYLEHRERDHARALELVRRGADGARLGNDPAMVAAFERRIARLERKLMAAAPRRGTE